MLADSQHDNIPTPTPFSLLGRDKDSIPQAGKLYRSHTIEHVSNFELHYLLLLSLPFPSPLQPHMSVFTAPANLMAVRPKTIGTADIPGPAAQIRKVELLFRRLCVGILNEALAFGLYPNFPH